MGECDLRCDLEGVGVPSIFQLIRSVVDLVMMLPTLDLSCEETTRSAGGSGFALYVSWFALSPKDGPNKKKAFCFLLTFCFSKKKRCSG